MVGILFLTVAFMGFSTLLISNERSHEQASQEAMVSNQFRSIAETIRSNAFNSIATNYQGFTFSIDELTGTGNVLVFVDETETTPEGQQLGLPRDLDGDGLATNPDVSASYTLLPIRIQATWTNSDGPQIRDLYMFLSQED